MASAATAGRQVAGRTTGGRAPAARREPRATTRTQKTTPDLKPPVRRATTSAGRSAPTTAAAAASSRRRVIVFGGLVGVMTMTGALLMAMQPAPLSPDAVKSLMAVETSAQVDALFATQTPVQAGRWKYIYVHHSRSATGNASVLADAAGPATALPDHFVIGNGEGAGDGEIQVGQRWNSQQPAGRTAGVDPVDPDCRSKCMVGDLDRSPPTPRQKEQQGRLVAALQDRLRIGREGVWVLEASGLPAGCGRYFPREAFRGALLP